MNMLTFQSSRRVASARAVVQYTISGLRRLVDYLRPFRATCSLGSRLPLSGGYPRPDGTQGYRPAGPLDRGVMRSPGPMPGIRRLGFTRPITKPQVSGVADKRKVKCTR